jgi:hypothetical protein
MRRRRLSAPLRLLRNVLLILAAGFLTFHFYGWLMQALGSIRTKDNLILTMGILWLVIELLPYVILLWEEAMSAAEEGCHESRGCSSMEK